MCLYNTAPTTSSSSSCLFSFTFILSLHIGHHKYYIVIYTYEYIILWCIEVITIIIINEMNSSLKDMLLLLLSDLLCTNGATTYVCATCIYIASFCIILILYSSIYLFIMHVFELKANVHF